MKFLYSVLLIFVTTSQIFAQNPTDYENRREAYIDTALLYPNSHIMNLEAYRNLPVTQQYVNDIISVMLTKSTIDFDIVKLIRVLFLGDGSLDSQILTALEDVPFWVNNFDTLRGYWSENHMIMWMSSDWLLHESYGKAIDANLEQRLKHYLQVKIDYGFYEFFSANYYPFTLSGLLNLADFAQDTEIKEKAALAAERLLKELLLVTTDKGVFYAASGRTFPDRNNNFYGQNAQHLVYLLTGFGEAPKGTSHGGSFLATSTLDISNVIASYAQEIDSLHYIGHSIDSVRIIHGNLAYVDRMMMQWSSGCYFHPDFALETATLITDSNMWNHVDFTDFRFVSGLGPQTIATLSQNNQSISVGTVNTGHRYNIFKNREIALTSMPDFWKGSLGFQQAPVVAAVGTTGVLTFSGIPGDNSFSRPGSSFNDHLPCVTQNKNVALVMYRPKEKIIFFGETQPEVTLYWHENQFDEEIVNGNWVFGRQDENYVAVRRHCTDIANGFYQCNQLSGQTWIIIVGNSHMYNSFEEFTDLALEAESTFETSWYIEDGQVVYASSINFDGNLVSYEWKDEEDPLNIVAVKNELPSLNVFPNPTNGLLNVEAGNGIEQNVTLLVYNSMGQLIYEKKLAEFTKEQIQTDNWSNGLYFVGIKTAESNEILLKKVIKN
jgi:hypothetical protein